MDEFKRVITLFDAIVINMGAIIGAGIFVIVGLAAVKAGPSIVISILVSALVALFTGLSFSKIASYVSKEGGVYEYAKDTLSMFSGFIGGWMWTFGNIIAVAAVSLSLGGYINTLFGTSMPTPYIAISAILLFMTINIFGIKNSVRTLAILVLLNISILALFVVSGLPSFNASNFSNPFPNGINGMMVGASLIFFAFTGFSRVTTLSGEVINPKKTIPRAIIISIILSTVIYLAVAVVLLGLVPYSSLAHSLSPLSQAISVLHNHLLLAIISLGGITATAAVAFTGILGTSRVFFAMGRDSELPRTLGIIDRFSTPMHAILFSSALGVVFILAISFGTIVGAANASILLSYLIINIAALNLTPNHPRHTTNGSILGGKFPIIPLLGIASILAVMLYITPGSLSVAGLILAIGGIYYRVRNTPHRRGNPNVPVRSAVRVFGVSRRTG